MPLLLSRFLKSKLINTNFGDLYMPSTGALMLLTALHTCDQVRGLLFEEPAAAGGRCDLISPTGGLSPAGRLELALPLSRWGRDLPLWGGDSPVTGAKSGVWKGREGVPLPSYLHAGLAGTFPGQVLPVLPSCPSSSSRLPRGPLSFTPVVFKEHVIKLLL